MSWIFAAVISHLLTSLTVVLDKFLLGSKRVSSPVVYTFYIGLLGLFALIFFPSGWEIISAASLVKSFIAGIIFIFGVLALYTAIQKARASQAIPVIGATIPIGALLIALCLFRHRISGQEIGGVLLLILGGLLVSFDLPLKLKKKSFFEGFPYALLAGGLLAVAYFIFQQIYQEENFLTGFVWTRLGAFLGTLGLLLPRNWRRQILDSLRGFRAPNRSKFQTGALFLTSKTLAGIASLALNYAIFMGSVVIVNAMASLQYVFILIFGFWMTKRFPEIFQEHNKFWDWVQRGAAILIIGLGLALIARSGEIITL